ncbi:MAG: Gfo/Idh/MocA family oxidoreductase [Lachnospiraceae bacterium]|nr:Gfo/Idh/MocA family oxidoreductase [Lachnospiraceae bacterium]
MNHSKPLTFIIVGSGWRSLFYARIAKKYPEVFELKYMLCRTQEKADRMAAEHNIPTTTSIEACEEASPDFVVIAASKNSLCQETMKWARKGFAVLCETPAACTLEELKELWDLTKHGAKIQIAEQYHRYPSMAAGLEAVKSGKLHEPYAVRLSMAHDYHGVSLIRRMLQPQAPQNLRLEWLSGEQYAFPVTETDSRYGDITDGRVKESSRSVITMRFAGGKMAFYDFDGILYHSYIRSRHVNVQGRDGEWNDTLLRYVDDDYQPKRQQLTPFLNPRYSCLETADLKAQSRQWQPFFPMSEEEDEYAIATMMLDMGEYVETGKEVYPMAEALEDAYVFLLMQEAVRSPGTRIIAQEMPWHC